MGIAALIGARDEAHRRDDCLRRLAAARSASLAWHLVTGPRERADT